MSFCQSILTIGQFGLKFVILVLVFLYFSFEDLHFLGELFILFLVQLFMLFLLFKDFKMVLLNFHDQLLDDLIIWLEVLVEGFN